MEIADNNKIPQKAGTVENQNSSSLEAQIVSQTPGRVRLRVTPAHRHQQKIAPIVNALKARLEIYRIKTNIPSGSITVLHGRELLSSQDMCIVLQDLGVNLVEVTKEPGISVSSSSSAAAEVIKTTTDLNQRVKTATNDAVDLRFLFPLSLGVLAMRQLIVKGWQLELIPWYVLAWYAFDSFIKLHPLSFREHSSKI
ncbi:MAG: hypothetical protein QNJ70_19365 [Xenococcaceae cyanobacterium MO_207.B15]|nr:hypothetical protein [Xenococcaceae cyanobacterium MO_207.B15]